MITPLYPTFQKRVKDSFEKLEQTQLEPWSLFNSGKPMRVKTHSGKQISYEGIEFAGSPEHVFWKRYVEPFMEEIVVEEIRVAVQMASERHVDGEALLEEVRELLLRHIKFTFQRMSEIDRRLKGKGYPDRIRPRSVDYEFSEMQNFVDLRIRAEKELWHRNRHEVWFKRNPFLVWLAGILVAAIAAYAAFK